MKRINIEYTEHELYLGFIENDERCIEHIYSENFKSVEQFILKNSGKTEDAKDIYQEAIIATWLNIKQGKFKVQNDKSIGGYIFQIAKYKWLDKLRSKEYRTTIRLLHDNRAEPEADADYGEAEERKLLYLKELYSHLNEKCKAILNRFYFEKKSLEEIGADLNYEAATVKTLKYRCMQKLRSLHHTTTKKNDTEQ